MPPLITAAQRGDAAAVEEVDQHAERREGGVALARRAEAEPELGLGTLGPVKGRARAAGRRERGLERQGVARGERRDRGTPPASARARHSPVNGTYECSEYNPTGAVTATDAGAVRAPICL